MTYVRWLHLTDLHCGLPQQRWTWPTIERLLFTDLSHLSKLCGPWDVVFFTGDLVQQGNREEFARLDGFLERLYKQLQQLNSRPIFLCVPGNHDLRRPDNPSRGMADLRKWTKSRKSKVPTEFWTDVTHECRELIRGSFENYTQWYTSHRLPRPVSVSNNGLLPGDFACKFTKDGTTIGIVGLNSAALQMTDGKFEKRLALHPLQLVELCGDNYLDWFGDCRLALLLTHHSPDWLSDDSSRSFAADISPPGQFALHLCGHLHKSFGYTNQIAGNTPSRLFQAQSTFGLETWGSNVKRLHGYAAGTLQFEEDGMFLRFWPRAVNMNAAGAWKVVPDYSFELASDEGTFAETVQSLDFCSEKVRAHLGSTPPDKTRTPSRLPLLSRLSPRSVLRNPYNFEHPARGEHFYGRRMELEKLVAAICEGRSVIVYGLQRFGKTSLIEEALDVELPAQHFQAIDLRVDLYATHHSLHTYFDFLQLLLIALRRRVAPMQAEIADVTESARRLLREASSPSEMLDSVERILRGAKEKLGRRPLLLFIDEFQEIEKSLVNAQRRPTLGHPLDSGLVRSIGSMAKSGLLQLVLCSRYSLLQLDSRFRFELLKLLTSIQLAMLDEPSAAALVRDPVKGVLTFSESAVRQILFLTGRHPYLLNYLCYAIFESVKEIEHAVVEVDHVSAVADSMVEDPTIEPHFRVLYEDFQQLDSGKPWAVLLAIAQNAPRPRGDTSVRTIGALAERFLRRGECLDNCRDQLDLLMAAQVVAARRDGKETGYFIVPDILRRRLRATILEDGGVRSHGEA